MEGPHGRDDPGIARLEESHDGTRTLLCATYDDELVREQDGEWRFERREWRMKATFGEAPS
jgi:hypothetical protein